MRSSKELPEGYEKIYSVDLQSDKKLAIFVNLLAVAIAAVLIIPMLFLVPIKYMFDMEKGLVSYMIRFVVLMVSTVLYLVLHELVHGISMKLCGTKKVKYGFTGMYAFAGSDDYYGKSAYIFIALAPVVLWGIVLAIITPLVSKEWFWIAYFIQIMNISGAAGDFYVTFKFLRFPTDILVKDAGTSMMVFSKNRKGTNNA
ncbi:MAG: DUF3267 domain-containing protein [Clostridia bacterium]|nr:DUF3267 domain-containing protein [Clostridia bacterium]MBQ8793915.1 DUF3267 domain-containing protein [Clostridia bacterium]